MTPPPQPPDVRSKWTQRAMETGFLFGAAVTAIIWAAAALRYAVHVASGDEALAPGPLVTGVMLSVMTIPILGFCTAVLFGMVTFFAELAVRFAGRGREPNVKALGDVLSQAERRFAPSADSPPEEAIRPPEGLTAPPPEPEAAPPNEEIRL